MSSIQVTRLNTLTGHRDGVFCLQPTSNDRLFLSAAGDGMIVLWDLEKPETGELIAKLPNSVYAIHHHRQSDSIIAGHNYDGIHILDWKNKKETGSLKLTTSAIFDIQSLENKLYIASGDGSIIQVDLQQLAIERRVTESENSARTIAINTTRGEFAVGYSDNYIRVFDLEGLNLIKSWKAHENSVFTLRYSPDGGFLFSGSRDARLKVWDTRSAYVKAEEVVAHMYAINHLEFSPDGKHFVTCSMDKSIKVWDAHALKLLKVIDRARHAGHGTSVNRLLWTNYKGQLLSASDDRTISVWNIIF